MVKKIGLYEAKTHLSSLISEVEATGEKILLTRHGKVVAEICPPALAQSPVRGGLRSQNFFMAEDFDAAEVGFEGFFNNDAEDIRVAEEGSKYGK